MRQPNSDAIVFRRRSCIVVRREGGAGGMTRTQGIASQILIVDDHPLFRLALASVIAATPDLEVVASVGTAREAIDVVRHIAIDLATVDVLMPTTSGAKLSADVFELQPRCKVLIVSAVDDPGLIADLLRGHVSGFAIKSQSSIELLDAIRQVLRGVRYVAPSISPAALEAALEISTRPLDRLTAREREVFELLIRGNSNDEIATLLFISRRTVETHRQRVMNKLSAHSIAQMQRIAARFGAHEV
jgi:DNA-binding NarL/FixJ family response regulator